MWSHCVLSVAPIGKCPTMSQTSCGLEQSGRELSCLASKHGSLTKSRNDLRHGCAAPASASSLACRLPANFPSAALCFLLPTPAKAQAAGLLSPGQWSWHGFLTCSPVSCFACALGHFQLAPPQSQFRPLSGVNLSVLRSPFFSFIHSSLLSFLLFLYFSERSRLNIYLWSEQIYWHKDSRNWF